MERNMTKMRELGLMTSPKESKKKKKMTKKPKAGAAPMPRRTSPRLMKKEEVGVPIPVSIGVAMSTKPEMYTAEHEKLLGDCKSPWDPTLDVSINNNSNSNDDGITCHQCRQKTVGLRTRCNQCLEAHGRVCGNCLYIRYGENLLEVNEKSSWSCPVCRGICNCSVCRQRNGWLPTGPLHQAFLQGYKSVAHYLLLTRRAQ